MHMGCNELTAHILNHEKRIFPRKSRIRKILKERIIVKMKYISNFYIVVQDKVLFLTTSRNDSTSRLPVSISRQVSIMNCSFEELLSDRAHRVLTSNGLE